MEVSFDFNKSKHLLNDNETNENIYTLGECFAVIIVGIYTLIALALSCWSAILLLTGDTTSGGPIGFVASKFLM